MVTGKYPHSSSLSWHYCHLCPHRNAPTHPHFQGTSVTHLYCHREILQFFPNFKGLLLPTYNSHREMPPFLLTFKWLLLPTYGHKEMAHSYSLSRDYCTPLWSHLNTPTNTHFQGTTVTHLWLQGNVPIPANFKGLLLPTYSHRKIRILPFIVSFKGLLLPPYDPPPGNGPIHSHF